MPRKDRKILGRIRDRDWKLFEGQWFRDIRRMAQASDDADEFESRFNDYVDDEKAEWDGIDEQTWERIMQVLQAFFEALVRAWFPVMVLLALFLIPANMSVAEVPRWEGLTCDREEAPSWDCVQYVSTVAPSPAVEPASPKMVPAYQPEFIRQWTWPGLTEASLRRHLKEDYVNHGFDADSIDRMSFAQLKAVHNSDHDGMLDRSLVKWVPPNVGDVMVESSPAARSASPTPSSPPTTVRAEVPVSVMNQDCPNGMCPTGPQVFRVGLSRGVADCPNGNCGGPVRSVARGTVVRSARYVRQFASRFRFFRRR